LEEGAISPDSTKEEILMALFAPDAVPLDVSVNDIAGDGIEFQAFAAHPCYTTLTCSDSSGGGGPASCKKDLDELPEGIETSASYPVGEITAQLCDGDATAVTVRDN
jgi:hypothetical protein